MIASTQQLFAARPESVREAREFVAKALDNWGLIARAEDIRLCLSELATNAVVHGTDPGQGFLVRLRSDDDVVRLEVQDSRRRRPTVRAPSADEPSGRGLTLVVALSDGWGVEDRTPAGKVVWSCFKGAGGKPR
ncbi:ATP-binding protein [Streptomyces spectabilis]|uniref:ATP-binding protein n=1 Tax=Streptomyces spectabilis TaxID=68270 RepID=A0A5P2X811_STRST|nr:ATP-binding protein [Streptomyces spectabilis]MBB5103758.1 anti-sigma regulatory factor (Ser/Thr protein kinase) [Streptomyces spectabilis]MCI3904001.1 ATP-binding protein [Streptomyces spectabilis]QEV61143.1 ATP-binding protein [Streptomyces spectabilis]GGV18949.1 ATP-binding protein [Streptomyces spectabilis]